MNTIPVATPLDAINDALAVIDSTSGDRQRCEAALAAAKYCAGEDIWAWLEDIRSSTRIISEEIYGAPEVQRFAEDPFRHYRLLVRIAREHVNEAIEALYAEESPGKGLAKLDKDGFVVRDNDGRPVMG